MTPREAGHGPGPADDPMAQHAELAIAAAEGRAPDISPDPFAEHDAATDARDGAEADRLGVTLDELRAARQFDMDPVEYAALRNVESIDDMETYEREAAVRREAEHRRLVERVKDRIG